MATQKSNAKPAVAAAKSRQAPATTGAKVGKPTAAAKPAKASKASKASAQGQGQGQGQGQRSRIATKTLRVTPAGKAFEGYNGARGECWQLVVANNGKPAANVIGQTYTGRGGVERGFDGSFIAFFVSEGLVELV